MKLDRFDALIISAVVVLLAAAAVTATTAGGGRAAASVQPRIHAASPDPDILPVLAAARTLIESGQAKEAASSLDGLLKDHPAEPEIHALLGQAYAREDDYPDAMKEFRSALSMDPDYVDKKSEKFIGKRIKAAMKEGMSQAKAALGKDPEDVSARTALRDAYYLERMLAGGCE